MFTTLNYFELILNKLPDLRLAVESEPRKVDSF
jgi:hypothetical protein